MFRSVCRMSWSAFVCICLYRRLSSANSLMDVPGERFLLMSLM